MVWIVEMFWRSWGATVGVALTREDGREVLRDWQRRNPTDRFRLRAYAAHRDKTAGVKDV